MDIAPIRKRAADSLKSLYKARYPAPGMVVEVDGFDARLARLQKFIKTSGRYSEILTKVRKTSSIRARNFEKARDVNARIDDVTLVALDIIPTADDSAISDVGISIYRGGEIQSYHFIVAGRENQRDFGTSQTVSNHEALSAIRAAFDGADFTVGHSIRNDFARLETEKFAIKRTSVLDTNLFYSAARGKNSHKSLEDIAT